MEGERGGREGGWREKGKWTRKEGRNSRKGRNGKREGITLITCTPIPLTLFILHPLTPTLPTTLTPFIMRDSTTLLWPRAEARWRAFLCQRPRALGLTDVDSNRSTSEYSPASAAAHSSTVPRSSLLCGV